ncbi:MAG: hypothetical protein PHU64_01390 [Candidatus Omnitrophica bacterium]|nr:hypothetical protein [Candidatus Omnitrophota bacterium]MDD5430355.1 hypothetical protein [Candidatus Omnitrophota bacterium]
MFKIFLAAIFMVGISFCVVVQAEEGMIVNPSPKLFEFTGDNEATLQPLYYPEFYDYSSDNPDCGDYLRDVLSGETLDTCSGYHREGSGCNYASAAEIAQRSQYQTMPGLSGLIVIPEGFEKTSKLLVKWTVRIEGYKPAPYTIWPKLCHPWHGTSYQRFGEGEAKTALFVGASANSMRQAGDDIVMTIPSAGETSIYQPNDPTQSGSFVLEPDYFADGKFPPEVYLEVRWKNETCMKLVSPADMRTLIVELIPVRSSN